MDKLQMAHEYAMQHLKNSGGKITMHSLCLFAWEYTDAMQAEADKRKPSGLPEALKDDPFKDLYPLIDWNKYGKGLYFWAMDENG